MIKIERWFDSYGVSAERSIFIYFFEMPAGVFATFWGAHPVYSGFFRATNNDWCEKKSKSAYEKRKRVKCNPSNAMGKKAAPETRAAFHK